MHRRIGLIALALTLTLTLSATTQAAPPANPESQPTQYDVLSWPRMSAASFGCYLEKTFGARDKKFNCSLKDYKNQGDVCKDPEAYSEGPEFPKSKASAIHPLIETAMVSFEHGELQEVSFTLKKILPETEVRRIFKLPAANATTPENVINISIQNCGKDSTCLSIEGFEHTGAGDVDCGAN